MRLGIFLLGVLICSPTPTARAASPLESIGISRSEAEFQISRGDRLVKVRPDQSNLILPGDEIRSAGQPVRVQTTTGDTLYVDVHSAAVMRSADSVELTRGDMVAAVGAGSGLKVMIDQVSVSPVAGGAEGEPTTVALRRPSPWRFTVNGFNHPVAVRDSATERQIAVVGQTAELDFSRRGRGWDVAQAEGAAAATETAAPAAVAVTGQTSIPAGITEYIGVVGNENPTTRSWFMFDGGGNGTGGPSEITVTRYPGDEPIFGLSFVENEDGDDLSEDESAELRNADVADVYWHVESTRVGYENARIQLNYTDEEIDGLIEPSLDIYWAPTLQGDENGKWTALKNRELLEKENIISADVEEWGYFAIKGNYAVPFWDRDSTKGILFFFILGAAAGITVIAIDDGDDDDDDDDDDQPPPASGVDMPGNGGGPGPIIIQDPI